MKIEANIHDCPGHIFSGYYVWYRVQAETKLVLKSNHYTLHLTSHYIPTSEFCLQGKKKKREKKKPQQFCPLAWIQWLLSFLPILFQNKMSWKSCTSIQEMIKMNMGICRL